MNTASLFNAVSRELSPSNRCIAQLVDEFLANFHSLEARCSLISLKSVNSLISRGHLSSDDPRVQNMVQLGIHDITRVAQRLGPSDICDALCVCPNEYLVSRFVGDLGSYTTRQLSLCLWSLGRHAEYDVFDSVSRLLMTHLSNSPKRLLEMHSRDWALMLYAWSRNMRKIQVQNDHLKRLDRLLEVLGSEQTKFKSFQELAMVMYSLGVIRVAQKGLNLDTTYTDAAANSVLQQLAGFIRRSRASSVCTESSISTRSLLACLCGLSSVGFKAQPLLVDLYRIIYRRVETMTPNQCAFSYYLFVVKSGLSDKEIANRIFIGATNTNSLSNTNLVNIIQALTKAGMRTEAIQFLNHAASRTMSPDQIVQCIESTAVCMDSPEEVLKFWYQILPPNIKTLKHLPPKLLVRLYICQRQMGTDPGLKNAISVSLIHRLKEHNHAQWGPDELISFAKELGRVITVPCSRKYHPIKPNLRERFMRHLWISVKHRRVPTHVLMNNLLLLDQIGTFRRLPYDLQMHLWKKAHDHQKSNMREPVPPRLTPNSWKTEWKFTNKLLIRIPTKEERQAMWSKYRKEQETKKVKADTEKMELSRSALAGEKTPIAQFIDTLRDVKQPREN